MQGGGPAAFCVVWPGGGELHLFRQGQKGRLLGSPQPGPKGQQPALVFGEGDRLLPLGKELGEGDAIGAADLFQRGQGGHHPLAVPGRDGGLGQARALGQLVFRPATGLP